MGSFTQRPSEGYPRGKVYKKSGESNEGEGSQKERREQRGGGVELRELYLRARGPGQLPGRHSNLGSAKFE
jgi:hypothetical protein